LSNVHSEQNQLFFRICSDHLSIEAIPKKRVRVDLNKLRDSALDRYRIIMWTPHFAVLKTRKGHEVTIRKDGRMVIRKAGSESMARKAASEILQLVLRNFGE
jgi:hypothetical protein